MPFNMGAFLHEQRKKAELSQAELAERLGYSRSQFISSWERGASLPPPSAIKALAEEFKMDEAYLRRQVADFAIQAHTEAILKRYGIH
nr:hypothetical protein CKG001_10420 [Bdellovibrio sp. CKG001]